MAADDVTQSESRSAIEPPSLEYLAHVYRHMVVQVFWNTGYDLITARDALENGWGQVDRMAEPQRRIYALINNALENIMARRQGLLELAAIFDSAAGIRPDDFAQLDAWGIHRDLATDRTLN